MPLPSWLHLAVLMGLVLTVCTFGVFAAGHFPSGSRTGILKTPLGMALFWLSLAIAATSAMLALVFAVQALPWYAAVIGAGLMILAAPLVAQCFPDKFVDSLAALLLLASIMLFFQFVAYRIL